MAFFYFSMIQKQKIFNNPLNLTLLSKKKDVIGVLRIIPYKHVCV